MKTFKDPLTQEEEKFYLQKYKEGDLEAKDVLVERNMRLVAHIVKKYNYADRDLEDLISIGSIGLIKAVNTFDMSKGSRLATYASKCIENELLMMLRAEKKKSKEISLYEPIGTDKEGNEINLMDVIETGSTDISEVLDLKEDMKKVYFVLMKLKPRERMVLSLRYGLFNKNELTQREIANLLGISRSYVSRIEKSALKKMRSFF